MDIIILGGQEFYQYRYHRPRWKTVGQLLHLDEYKRCDLCQAFVTSMTLEPLNRSDRELPIQVIGEAREPGWDEPFDLLYIEYILGDSERHKVRFRIWRGKYMSSHQYNRPHLVR